MQKITVTDEDQHCQSFIISGNETPSQILRYCHLDPDMKIVYLNGQILSRAKMEAPINTPGNIFLSIKNKRYLRG